MAMAFMIPYTILVDGVYAGLIGTISAITIGSCSIIKSLYVYQNPDVTKIIKELDIDRRLKLIRAVMNNIQRHPQKQNPKMSELEKSQICELIGSTIDLSNDPIEICLISLKETIKDINNDLSIINQKIAYHNTKWFNSWRKLNIQRYLENLKTNSHLLDLRFNDLTKICSFLHKKLIN